MDSSRGRHSSSTASSSDSLDASIGLRRVAVRGGALAASGFLTSQAISFIGFVVLARLAPPATFGAYAAASVLLGTSALFVEAGMQAAVIQRQDRVQAAASTALAANLVGGLCLAALAAALAPVIGLFFDSGDIARAAAVMAGTIPINAAAIVPGALLQRVVSYRFPFLESLGSLAYVIAGIIALSGGLGLWGLVTATYIAAATRTTAVWALSEWRPSLGLVSWSMWRSLSRYGRPVVLSAFLREVGITGTTAVVGRALGTGALGRFRAAQRLVLQSNSAIVYGSAYVLLPVFSRIWQEERRFQESILRALRTLTLIVFPLSLVFIPLGRPFATILLGERWRGAGPIMMAMAGIGVALALDSVSSEAFKAVGRTDLLPRLHGLTAILPIGLMFPLLRFGAAGAGLAMSLGMCIVAMYAIGALSQVARLPLRIILAQLRPATTCAVLMAGGVYLVDRYVVHAAHNSGLVGVCLLALDLVAAMLLYLGLLLLLSRGSVVELRDAARLLLGRVENAPSTAAG
jgi:O-antigen/teichoic acid export membrane protein